MKRIAAVAVAGFSLLLLTACARVAVRASGPLIANMMVSVFEECDPQLAREAIPANLKLLEGLARSDPGNTTILKALSAGFAGYALLFLEEDDPARASVLYIRSRDYALRALGARGEILKEPEEHGRTSGVLQDMERVDLEPLFWAAFSWNAWINLNLDKPEALSQFGVSQACLERVLAIDSTYMHGLPTILQGAVLSARPRLLGGNQGKGESFFKKGLEQSGGRFLPARYYYARYYAVAAQDRDLFRTLLEASVKAEPGELRDMCLVNAVFKERAAKLLAKEDELFY
jgi:hypothetical protein